MLIACSLTCILCSCSRAISVARWFARNSVIMASVDEPPTPSRPHTLWSILKTEQSYPSSLVYLTLVSSLHLNVSFTSSLLGPYRGSNTRSPLQVDSFSFGVVLWEIITKEQTHRGNWRPVRVPEECPAEVESLLKARPESQTHSRTLAFPNRLTPCSASYSDLNAHARIALAFVYDLQPCPVCLILMPR